MAKKRKIVFGISWMRILVAFIAVIILSVFLIAWNLYEKLYAPNVRYTDEQQYLYVPTGCTYDELKNILTSRKIVFKIANFDWTAQRMDLPQHIHAGRYKLDALMNNTVLVKKIGSGEQDPLNLVIGKFRLEEDFASFLSKKIEADSASFMNVWDDSSQLSLYQVNRENVMALFIPNTYQFFWNTNADQFMQRMKSEYDVFWNESRKEKAVQLNLTPQQVMTLASIVEEETNDNAEKPRIAGVYLNRLRRNMLLQADPTVKFALKNFSLRRIFLKDTRTPSPYNTYKNEGLPPGPICIPSISTIDSVLHAERNDYLYFCADPDHPGTHVFAKTLQQQLIHAKKYQQWLDQQGIGKEMKPVNFSNPTRNSKR